MRILCVDIINIVDKKDVINVKGPRVDMKQASGEKSVKNQSTVFLKGACPNITIKPHQMKVKSLKKVPWNQGDPVEDEEVVADIKLTVGYQQTHQSRKRAYLSIEISKEDVKAFQKKINHQEAITYEDMEYSHNNISMLTLILRLKKDAESLVKVLDEGFVDKGIISSHFKELMRGMLANDKITFSDDDRHVRMKAH